MSDATKTEKEEVVRPPESSGIGDTAETFGKEGTNKTLPVPEPDASPDAELQGTKSKFVPKAPYTRQW
ncbi:MAG: hypothetical protein JWQ72_1279 [Polaromonas sp.]|nr:hypothetical protein [Polaromonas sp.]